MQGSLAVGMLRDWRALSCFGSRAEDKEEGEEEGEEEEDGGDGEGEEVEVFGGDGEEVGEGAGG